MARVWTSEQSTGNGKHHGNATPVSIEPDSRLHISISGRASTTPRLKASRSNVEITSDSTRFGGAKSNGFRPALDGRADRAGRARYFSEEYCFKDTGSLFEAHISLHKERKWKSQGAELLGMDRSPSNETYLSKGRDGYNSPYESILVIHDRDFENRAAECGEPTLSIERFLTTPGPWTHLRIFEPRPSTGD